MALFRKHEGRQVLELPVDALVPNPNQPRRHFSQEELEELAGSISQLGVLQPLTVRRSGQSWELIAGERRWRAARLAGLATVPCLEVAASDETSSLMALVENLQRKDLDFWEEALALRQLVDTYHLSQEEVARRVGKSQSAVANKLRLLKLPADVLDSLRSAGLTERTPAPFSGWTALSSSGRPPPMSSATSSPLPGRRNMWSGCPARPSGVAPSPSTAPGMSACSSTRWTGAFD